MGEHAAVRIQGCDTGHRRKYPPALGQVAPGLRPLGRDVLVWTPAPFLLRNVLTPVDRVTGPVRPAEPGEVKRTGANPVIASFAREDSTIEQASAGKTRDSSSDPRQRASLWSQGRPNSPGPDATQHDGRADPVIHGERPGHGAGSTSPADLPPDLTRRRSSSRRPARSSPGWEQLR